MTNDKMTESNAIHLVITQNMLPLKADITLTSAMSVNDPKRTSSPAKNQAHLKEKSNSSSSLLSVRRLSAVGRYNARHRRPSQNRRQLYQQLNKTDATSCQNGDHRAYKH
jgi:hypothetical protein